MKKIKVFIMLVFSTLSYSAGSIGDKGEENSSEIESVKVEELEKIKNAIAEEKNGNINFGE